MPAESGSRAFFPRSSACEIAPAGRIRAIATLDDFLGEKDKRNESEAIAVKEVPALQIEQAMRDKNISRKSLAQRKKTSRSSIGHLLEPKDANVTLATLQRAARRRNHAAAEAVGGVGW